MLAASYGYDAVGNLQNMRYANGVTNLYQYDRLNRLTNGVWKVGSTSVASFAYALGATGNRTNLTDNFNGTTRSYAWTYDPLYRLTNENISVLGNVGYGYDVVGNRTNRASTISGLTNQIYTFNTNDWLNIDSYDSNGNTTISGTNAYHYDAMNRLTNVNNSIFITYDGDGNRVSKKVGTTTTFYLLDDRNPSGYVQVVEEWTVTTSATNLAKVYNYGSDLISQRVPNTSTNYFIYDGHGSTRALTDNAGNVANIFTYDAYGTLIVSNTTAQTFYLYSGQQFDPDLGQYYLRARTYNQNTGRFWTMDTDQGDNQNPLSLHKYLYCDGNPLNRLDPSGHDGDLVSLMSSISIQSGMAAMRLGPSIFARVAAQRTITKVGAIAAGAFISAWFGYNELAGDAPNPTQTQKLQRAEDLIAGDGFGDLAKRASGVTFRVIDDLVMSKDAWGYTPFFADQTVWLDSGIFNWDNEAFAAIVIHETEHTMTYANHFREGPSYQVESDFLWTEGLAGRVADVIQKLPNTDPQWAQVQADSMRDYGVKHPAITN
jgi:RHS repeat-associated protein